MFVTIFRQRHNDQINDYKHYLSHHQGSPVTALFPRDLHNWYGLPAQGVAIDEWADDNFDHGSLDFIGGANLWVHTDRKPLSAAKMSTFGEANSLSPFP